jgi:aspartyl-tRNA(Asn)/glutamyl-tRNA(Gln) amidotransferase subunit A
MTRTVSDAALMLQVMAGPDIDDPLSYGRTGRGSGISPDADRPKSLKGWKIAWSPTLGNTAVDHQTLELTQKAAEVFRDLGCDVAEAQPEFEPTEALFLVLFHTSLATRLSPYVESFGDRMDPTLLDAIEKGHRYKAVELQETIYSRSRVFQTIQHFFERFDLLLTPTVSRPALPADHNALDPIEINGKAAGSMRGAWYPYTHPFNMAGNPAISIPCGWTEENLPVGLQIVGSWLAEYKILQAAAAFEAAHPWCGKRPPV